MVASCEHCSPADVFTNAVIFFVPLQVLPPNVALERLRGLLDRRYSLLWLFEILTLVTKAL